MLPQVSTMSVMGLLFCLAAGLLVGEELELSWT